jgi:hypothetical protein
MATMGSILFMFESELQVLRDAALRRGAAEGYTGVGATRDRCSEQDQDSHHY